MAYFCPSGHDAEWTGGPACADEAREKGAAPVIVKAAKQRLMRLEALRAVGAIEAPTAATAQADTPRARRTPSPAQR